MPRVLVDTGPLVAILSRRDARHTECVEALREIAAPMFTCWPVITEAAWLLRADSQAVRRLLESMGQGFLELVPLVAQDAAAIAVLMNKYPDLRPQLADLALVHLATRDGFETIFTLDQRDFAVYRAAAKGGFRVLPEEGL